MVSKLISGKIFLVVGMGSKSQVVGLDEDVYIHMFWTGLSTHHHPLTTMTMTGWRKSSWTKQVVRVCREQLAEAPIRIVFYSHF